MRVLVASIVALQLVAKVVHADATEDAAQVHLERGIAAFRAGDFTRAHHELAAASELVPHKPNPYRWLALTEVQLGDCARAIVNIESFLSRAAADDDRIAELVRLRELCQRTGVLQITSIPSRVSLRLDGALVGETPYRSLSMRAGPHVVVADKPGFVSASRSIVVPAGSSLDVRLELSATRARAPVTRRWWFWAAVAGAAITVAGVAIYVATDDAPSLLPPIHCDPAGCRPGGA
jgi:hypothetical protein